MQEQDVREIDRNLEITNKLLLEMVKSQKMATKNLIRVFVCTILGYTLILIAMTIGFFVYESQFELIDSEHEHYEYEQEVSGDDSEINNVQGNQYNDSSTHNEN